MIIHTNPAPDRNEVPDALRAWAKGIYPLEAGVELLARCSGGRFARPGSPWIQPGDDPDWWWIDTAAFTEDNYGALSGGEIRMLRIAASLLGGPTVDLYANIAGLDRDQAELVLAAISHANGSHEHTGRPVPDPDGRLVSPPGERLSFTRPGSLHPWP